METLTPNPQVDRAGLEEIGKLLLLAIGEDPERDGLKETPKRFAAWWTEFIDYDPGRVATSFTSNASDQMVIVSGIRVWSLCEHHLLPFSCDLTIGYVTKEVILGLSKFARIAQKFAHRLQVQERLVSQIADEICNTTRSPDIAVIGQGKHLCMTMRGVQSPALMTTSIMRGVFRHNEAARSELISLAGSITSSC